MKYIILIGDDSFNLGSIESIHHVGSTNSYYIDKDRYCIDYGTDHVFYDYDKNLINEYDENEKNVIPYNNPRFILMIYQNESRMNEILRINDFFKDIWIDNDHGLITSIAEFVKLGMPISWKANRQ